ncbi:hypothetical protein BZA77DRAFT_344301 [Pyronema omphalodes]|nr:hypothetical protein BZA77DRAFT_344301 [Pyronema omphalodes]
MWGSLCTYATIGGGLLWALGPGRGTSTKNDPMQSRIHSIASAGFDDWAQKCHMSSELHSYMCFMECISIDTGIPGAIHYVESPVPSTDPLSLQHNARRNAATQHVIKPPEDLFLEPRLTPDV